MRIRDRRRSIELGLERFEERCLLSSIVVDSLAAGSVAGKTTLSDAIKQANLAPNSTITFSVTGVINLTTAADLLPAIAVPTTIQGTSTLGAPPVVEIDGNGLTGDGLDLGPAGGGSTIEGLSIVNFAGDGINIVGTNGNTVEGNDIGLTLNQSQSPNTVGIATTGTGNTIGGSAFGAGNTIFYGTGTGVDSSGGTVTTIRGNLITGTTGTPIVSDGQQAAPSLTSVTSNGHTTTIVGSGTGTTFDFYATNGTLGPAAVYLGSSTSFPATLNVTVPTGASVVATATSAAGDTSALSAAVTATNPFAVTTTAATGAGSLEQAILNVNADTGNPYPDTIFFGIGAGAKTILLTSVLTPLTHPVIIDGTTQPGFAGTPLITIDGGALSGSILTLGTGSASSTIRGLAFTNFAGTAIEADTSTDVVQSNSIAVASSGATGVLVTAIGDIVQSNAISVTGVGATGVLVHGAGHGWRLRGVGGQHDQLRQRHHGDRRLRRDSDHDPG